jgi:hypothetical protein
MRPVRRRKVPEAVVLLVALAVGVGATVVAAEDTAVAAETAIAAVVGMADTAAVVDVRGANRVIRLFQALDAPIFRQGRL